MAKLRDQLKCPNCGAYLTREYDIARCAYCGGVFETDESETEDDWPEPDPEAENRRQYDLGYQQARAEYERQREQDERALEEKVRKIVREQPRTVYVERPAPSQPRAAEEREGHKHLFWWVMGWIFLFPVPLTILIARSRNIPKWLKALLIAGLWLAFVKIAGKT